MSIFELKKTLENEYPLILKVEKLKGISFKIFHGLEEVVKGYGDFTLTKQEYNDKPSLWSSYLVKGKLSYNSYKDNSLLEIDLTGWIKRASSGAVEGGYNKMDVRLQSEIKEVDTKVVSELVNKFKSFEDAIQRIQERLDRLIFSEE